MPYETGTATGVADLISKIATFAAANGWTIHSNGARTAGAGSGGTAVLLSRGAVFGAFLGNNGAGGTSDPGPWIEVYQFESFSAGSTETQPNKSINLFNNWMAGPYVAYHFFTPPAGATNPYLHIVVEVQSGSYRHFGIGQIRRFGNFTNGVYNYVTAWDFGTFINNSTASSHSGPFDGGGSNQSRSDTRIRVDFGGASPQWGVVGQSATAPNIRVDAQTRVGATGAGINTSLPYSICGPSGFTGRTPLTPIMLWAWRDTVSQLRHPIGYPEDIRVLRMDNFQPNDTITIGADTWRVFPFVRRNGTAGQQNSGLSGFAYRQT